MQPKSLVFLHTTVLLLDFNKLKIGTALYFSANYFAGVAVSDLVPLSSRNRATGSPTHFFMILTSCGNLTFSPVDCVGLLRVRSFILPHRSNHTESCAVSHTSADTPQTAKHDHASHYLKPFFPPQTGSDLMWVEDWLQLHVARVRDIELLTGLSFYHDRLSVAETLELKTFIHRAQQPQQ